MIINKEEEFNLLKNIICEVIEKLYREDQKLILVSEKMKMRSEINLHAGERAIAFRFGLYLENLLRSNRTYISMEDGIPLNLDMEYNRHLYEKKALSRFPRGIEPDLIIHKRGEDEHNFLVIEFKTWWNKEEKWKQHESENLLDKDCKKLESLVKEYKYKYGLLIVFEKEKEACIESFKWFQQED
ncbi:MAG: hypothetical protein AB9856_03585 [Cellulosilyticaceae bacterium]